MERVVNIIGLGKSALSVSDTGENWGLCGAYKYQHKLDKLFFMDSFNIWIRDGHTNMEPKDYTFDLFLKDNPDVQLISKFDDRITGINGETLARINAYPLNEALKLIPGAYFTSTIAYTIAYAILEKVDRIRLYGFEVWSGSDANEYNYQKDCVDFWLAFALGRGIKVEIPYYLMLTIKNNQNYYGYFEKELKK